MRRYKTDDRVDSGVVTAAQVAMLGGQWRPTADEEAGADEDEAPAKKAKGPSKAMPVADFLAKGDAGTLLPRTKQDRRCVPHAYQSCTANCISVLSSGCRGDSSGLVYCMISCASKIGGLM